MNASPKQTHAPWLLLLFTLPTAKASERVGVWRKLQRYGAVALPASGYVLPNSPMNQERFEWLATSIRGSKGRAAVAQVSAFDDLEDKQIERMFTEARTREYQALEKEVKKLASRKKRGTAEPGAVRLRKRLEQIAEIDFFGAPIRARIEEAMRQLAGEAATEKTPKGKENPKNYRGRTWITRPQPGIDRVASAWLISCYIDPQAKFAFDKDPRRHPDAIPFDM